MDYENIRQETLKAWEKEHRMNCRAEMRQYLMHFPDATQEEIRELREWIKSGHSPYENGDYIATETGRPMDFINARRFQEEYLEYLIDSNGIPGNSGSNDDLPF